MTETRITALLDTLADTAPEPDTERLLAEVHASAGLRRLRARRPRRSLTPVLVAAATVVAVLVAVGVVAVSRSSRPLAPAASPPPPGAAPLEAGRAFAQLFFSTDYRTVDDYSDRVSAATTGGFRSDFDAKRTQLRTLTGQARSVARGRVLAAAVRDVRPATATVLVVADQDVTNVSTGTTPTTERYRVRETLRLVDGRWLVDGFEPIVGGPVPAPADACADPTASADDDALLRQTCSAIGTLYSYDYHRIDADVAAQLALTTGDLRRQIEDDSAPALRQVAPKSRVQVSAAASTAAIERIDGDTATVLAFLDQTVRSELLPQPRYDRNRVEVTMHRVDGRWLVAGIKAL